MTRKIILECEGEIVTEIDLPPEYDSITIEEDYDRLLWRRNRTEQVALEDAGIKILEEE
jgi:hypothetical protein